MSRAFKALSGLTRRTVPEPGTAQVIAPPNLMALGALVVGLLLQWLIPMRTLSLIPVGSRAIIGLILIVLGAALVRLASNAFNKARAPVSPWQPVEALVTAGVFAHMRNPMYFGKVMALAGVALALAVDCLALTTACLAALLHYGVVLREERYLEVKFGDDYRAYKGRVPRYGWKV